MTEADLQTIFTRFLRKDSHGLFAPASAFELKLVRCTRTIVPGQGPIARENDRAGAGAKKRAGAGANSCSRDFCASRLAPSRVSEGQEEALSRVACPDGKGDGLAYKISDSGVGYLPFDCFYMRGCPAYLIIGWACLFGEVAEGKCLRVWKVGIEEWRKWKERRRGKEGLSEREILEGGIGDRVF